MVYLVTNVKLIWVTKLRSTAGTGLVADMCLTADPGVGSWIPARSHSFVEVDHEIILLYSSLPLIQEGLLSVTS